MIRAAKKVSRHGVRDGAIILLMFRHGLRTAVNQSDFPQLYF